MARTKTLFTRPLSDGPLPRYGERQRRLRSPTRIHVSKIEEVGRWGWGDGSGEKGMRRWEWGDGGEVGVGRWEWEEGSGEMKVGEEGGEMKVGDEGEEMRVGRREWEERKWDMIVGDGSGEISPPPTPSHFL